MVLGWAYSPNRPDLRVTVRVFLRDEEIGSAVADQFRQDLADAGVGDRSGCYMFRFMIPDPLREHNRLELRFLTSDGEELKGSPLQIVEPAGASFRLNGFPPGRGRHSDLEILPAASGGNPELPLNSGLAYLNRRNCAPGPRTTIILGHARSGTSMAARALHILGLPMGLPDPAPANYEDEEFVRLFQGAKAGQPLRVDLLKQLIQRRNGMHESWGFKAPSALDSLSYLLQNVRNPRLVLIFRDLLATSLREFIAAGAELWESFESILAYQTTTLKLLRNTDVPCFLVSYEKAILNPHFFCAAITEFVGMRPDSMRVDEAVRQINPNQPDYLQAVLKSRRDLGLTTLGEARSIRSSVPADASPFAD